MKRRALLLAGSGTVPLLLSCGGGSGGFDGFLTPAATGSAATSQPPTAQPTPSEPSPPVQKELVLSSGYSPSTDRTFATTDDGSIVFFGRGTSGSNFAFNSAIVHTTQGDGYFERVLGNSMVFRSSLDSQAFMIDRELPGLTRVLRFENGVYAEGFGIFERDGQKFAGRLPSQSSTAVNQQIGRAHV